MNAVSAWQRDGSIPADFPSVLVEGSRSFQISSVPSSATSTAGSATHSVSPERIEAAIAGLDPGDPETARISMNAMWFLVPLPFLYTMNAFYSGLLSKAKRTMPILESQMASLLIVTLMVLATVNLDPIKGVYVVSASSVVAMSVAYLWVWFAWRRHDVRSSRGELGDVDAVGSNSSGAR